MDPLWKALDKLLKYLNLLVIVAMLIMTALVFLNVVLRYGFNSGISVSVEISRFLFVWLTFIGAIIALRHNEHLEVSFVMDRMGVWWKKLFGLAGTSAMLGCCLMLTIGAYKQAVLSWDTVAPISELPVGIFYLAGLVSGAFMTVILAFRIVGLIANRPELAPSETAE